MPLDPIIAAGFKGLQLQDPLERYARVNALQQAQQQNAVNALKMQEYQRERETSNALNRAYSEAYNPQTGDVDINILRRSLTTGGYGSQLPAIEKQLSEAQAQRLTRNKAETDLVGAKLAQSRTLLDTIDPSDPNAPQQFMAWHEANHADPVLGPVLQRMGVTAEQSRARIAQAVSQGPEALSNLIAQAREGQAKFAERFKPMIVSPGASVYQPGSATAMFTAPSKPEPTPADIQGYNLAVSQGFKGSYLDYKQSLQPKPAQTIVKLPEQEKAERGERGKLLVKQYEGVSEAAKVAARTLPALETQVKVLDEGFKTGFGTDAQKIGASLLGALGVPEAAKFATDAQKFLGAAQSAVLQRQLEQKGPQTEADAQRISQTGAQLGNTPEANRFIIDVAKAQLKRDIEQRNFYDKWWKENKTYDGAEDAWFGGEGGRSLFDRSELKKYATPPAAAPAAAPAAGGKWRVVR